MTISKHRIAEKSALLAECRKVLSESYPRLDIVETDPHLIVRGVFPIHFQQQEIDQFLIEITFPDNYSSDIPRVKELGNRIPRDVHHHVFIGDFLCLFVRDQRWQYWNSEKGIAGYFSEALNDFFLSFLYFEQYGEYPFGERSHGLEGVFEYYEEEFETKDRALIMRGLEYLSQKEIKGHWTCYCGSGLKLRNCHGQKLWELHDRIAYQDAWFTLKTIQKAVDNAVRSRADR